MIKRYTIGRDPNNNIVVQDPMVSGYHSDLVVDDSSGYVQYTYIDHSTNGTFINGQLLRNASCYVVFNDMVFLAGKVPLDWDIIGRLSSEMAYPQGPERRTDFSANPNQGISFGGALKSFFNNYANFKGRATRQEYWFAYLWLIIIQTGLSFLLLPIVLSSIGGALDDYDTLLSVFLGMGWYVSIWTIYGLAMFLPSLSILVRRIHDTGRDGLWILMMFVPIANIVFFFIWTLSASENRTNKWGAVKR